MKSIFKLLLVGVSLTTFSTLHAQTTDTMNRIPPSGSKFMNIETGEYVYMKHGKMMLHHGTTDEQLHTKYYCSNATTVATDGTVTHKDGTTTMLQDGDKITKNGKLRIANRH